MKLKVLQEDLATAISTALRFTSSKVQLPVLANILLKAEKGKFFLKATNLEASVAIVVGAKIDQEGEITVPAKSFFETISNLPKGQISIEAEKEKVGVSAPNFKSTLLGMNSADFPKIIQEISGDNIEIPTDSLSTAFGKTLFSVSLDETRPVLTGVLLILDKDITLVATDGFRLSQKKLSGANVGVKGRMILPKNTLSEISKISSEESILKFSHKADDKQGIFACGGAVLTSRVIEGEFPDFEKIIPKSFNLTVSLDKQDFMRAVKLAGVFARDSANLVKLKIGSKSLEVYSESAKSGSQETSVEAKVEGVSEEEFVIAFNYRFLEEAISAVEDDFLTLKFTDPNSPAGIFDNKDPDFLHIIMPIRL